MYQVLGSGEIGGAGAGGARARGAWEQWLIIVLGTLCYSKFAIRNLQTAFHPFTRIMINFKYLNSGIASGTGWSAGCE
jgi:hypothetical protein